MGNYVDEAIELRVAEVATITYDYDDLLVEQQYPDETLASNEVSIETAKENFKIAHQRFERLTHVTLFAGLFLMITASGSSMRFTVFGLSFENLGSLNPIALIVMGSTFALFPIALFNADRSSAILLAQIRARYEPGLWMIKLEENTQHRRMFTKFLHMTRALPDDRFLKSMKIINDCIVFTFALLLLGSIIWCSIIVAKGDSAFVLKLASVLTAIIGVSANIFSISYWEIRSDSKPNQAAVRHLMNCYQDMNAENFEAEMKRIEQALAPFKAGSSRYSVR